MVDGHLPGRTGFFCPAFRYAGDPASLMTEVPIMIPKPEYDLELSYKPVSAEHAAGAISEALSAEYELYRDDSYMLEHAGRSA